MDRKPDIESNYPREAKPEPIFEEPKTSLMTPIVVVGMMVSIVAPAGLTSKNSVVVAILGLILFWLAYKIVWVEKQFWVSSSENDGPQKESLQSVNEFEEH